MIKKPAFLFTFRPKMIAILGIIFLVTGCSGYFIANHILLRNVLQIEKQLIKDNVNRVKNIFNEEVERLKAMSEDWAHWDDTHNFAQGKKPDFVKQNLIGDVFKTNKWSYFLVFNTKLKQVYAQGYNIEKEEEREIPPDIAAYFNQGSYFFSHPGKPVGGFVLIQNRLQFVASSDIRFSDKKGPIGGYLVLMRPLDPESLSSYSKNLQLPLQINYLNQDKNLAITPENFNSLLKNKELISIQPNKINIELLLEDVNKKPIAIISFQMERNVYQNSKQAINFFLGLLAITGLLSLLALGLLINFAIIKRVELFNKQITDIANQKDYESRVDIAGHDELTSMARQVNFLLDVIKISHQELENRNEELKALELEKRHIIEYTPESIVITNDKTEIRLINNATKETFNCTIDEIQDQPLDQVFSLKATNEEGRWEEIPLSQQESITLGKEYVVTYKDKSLPIELKTSLINNNSKIYILRDISERKKQEKELARLNQKLIMLSREAGMSDVSTMILHNIGNILNSVLVTLGLMQEEMAQSKLNNLGKIRELLQQNLPKIDEFLTQDEKGKKIPSYVILMAEYWLTASKKLSEQFQSLDSSINKIMDVIKNFQFHHASTVVEKINLVELFDSVLNIHQDRFKKHNITVIKHYSSISTIHQDRFKIWHILNNIITNAIDAVKAAEQKQPTIELYIEEIDNKLRVKIDDNGIGIDPKELVSIFLFRHTSKANGNGIGLHSSSILAKEIGATLNVKSEGLGKGASFILDIPREIPNKLEKFDS